MRDRTDMSMDRRDTSFTAFHVGYCVLDDITLYQTFTSEGCCPSFTEEPELQALLNRYYNDTEQSPRDRPANFVEWVVAGYRCKIEFFSEVDCEGYLVSTSYISLGSGRMTLPLVFRSFRIEFFELKPLPIGA